MKANIISCITTIMCRYEKCPQNPLMPSHHPLRHDSSVVRNSYFFEALETFPWRREWVKAVLRCLRRKEAIAPSDQPIPSLQALEYLEMLGLKIARGMKNIQFEETYDEWNRLLRAVLSNFQLSSFGREKMKFLKLSQMNGLDK